MSDIDELLKRAEICDYDHTSCDALISDLAAALRAHVAMSAEAFATSECEAENDRLRLAWGAASTALDAERAARVKAETELEAKRESQQYARKLLRGLSGETEYYADVVIRQCAEIERLTQIRDAYHRLLDAIPGGTESCEVALDVRVGDLIANHDRLTRELEKVRAELAEAEAALTDARANRERLEVQLAGCGVAALGWSRGNDEAKQGDYGWSASYGDVVTIRKELEKVRAELAEVRQGYEALDTNWSTLHEASMSAIREAMGNQDATVPDICAELARRKGGAT